MRIEAIGLALLVVTARAGADAGKPVGRVTELPKPGDWLGRVAVSPDGSCLLAYQGGEGSGAPCRILRFGQRRWRRGPNAVDAAWGPDSATVALRDGSYRVPGALRLW